MPPQKTIIVNEAQLLENLGWTILFAVDRVDDLIAELSESSDFRSKQEAALLRKFDRPAAFWPTVDLAQLAGKPLTESERKRHQQAIVRMEQAGLIVRHGRRASLTAQGWIATGLEPPTEEGT